MSKIATGIAGIGAFAFFIISARALKVGPSLMSAKAFGGCAIGLNILMIPSSVNELSKREERIKELEAKAGEISPVVRKTKVITHVVEIIGALGIIGLGAACIGGAPVFKALAITGVSAFVVIAVIVMPEAALVCRAEARI